MSKDNNLNIIEQSTQVTSKDKSLVESQTQKSTKKPKPEPHAISNVINEFIQSIRSIGQAANIVLPHVSKWLNDEIRKTEKQLYKFLPETLEPEASVKFKLDSARDAANFSNMVLQINDLRANKSPIILARSLFTQMFSEFDAFTGALLKLIYIKNDQLLKGISREISLADLLEYEDLNAVKQAMLEKEIDTFRRDSYVEQFATLEKNSTYRFESLKSGVNLSN
jgi:hypothetical protein